MEYAPADAPNQSEALRQIAALTVQLNAFHESLSARMAEQDTRILQHEQTMSAVVTTAQTQAQKMESMFQTLVAEFRASRAAPES